MSLYRFAESPLVDEIAFVHTEKGGVRAYLHAHAAAKPEELERITAALGKGGLHTVPFNRNGQHTLEVRGFSEESALLKQLKQLGAVQGTHTHKTTDEKMTWWDILRERTLQVSGAFYLLGDAAFTMYGYKGANPLDMAAGGAYFAGTSALVGFGNNDQADIQIKDISTSLEQFLKKEKGTLPTNCSLNTITRDKPKGLIGGTLDLFRRYPAEWMNFFYGVAGTLIATSAYRGRVRGAGPLFHNGVTNKSKMAGLLDIGLGAMTTASGALSILVQEKKPDPDEPPATGLGWVWQKVQEKPLAIAGVGYIVSTLCHAASTIIEYKEAKLHNDQKMLKSVPYRGIFVGANLVAEALLAISSKGHGEGVTSDASVKESVYALVAEMIASQPASQRDWYVHHVAGFLQQPNVLAEAYNVVETRLREEIAHVEKNPWRCGARAVAPSQTGSSPEIVPATPVPAVPLAPLAQMQPWQVQPPPSRGLPRAGSRDLFA